MSPRDLPPTRAEEYVAEIRRVFQIEELAPIDFRALDALPSEIERRRAIWTYFIPDIFQSSGRYDRRADIIDASIYFLLLSDPDSTPGRRADLMDFWTARAGFKKRFRFADVEEDPYGYMFYHPQFYTLMDLSNPGDFLPQLVRYLRGFVGRKRKLDNTDYALIFGSIYHAPPTPLSPKLYQFLALLQGLVEQPAQGDALDIPQVMQDNGFGNPRALYGQFNQLGVVLFPVYEPAVFGLQTYIIRCPDPYHFKVRYKQNLIVQDFLTGGRHYIQAIQTSIPANMDWTALYRRFHRLSPNIQFYRWTFIPSLHQSFLKYFDLTQQDWRIPWDTVTAEWQAFLPGIDAHAEPVHLTLPTLEPSDALLRTCQLLTDNSNLSNKAIVEKTGLPEEEIQKARQDLNACALVARPVLLTHANIVEYTYVTVKGAEQWKYLILAKLGDLCPLHFIAQQEDVVHKEMFLSGLYWHTPQMGIEFTNFLSDVLYEAFSEYWIHTGVHLPRFVRDWVATYWDSTSATWTWDADDYEIQPLTLQLNAKGS